MLVGEFVEAGYALRPDKDRVEIHIGADTFELTTDEIHQVLMFGSYEHVYLRVPQTTLDGCLRGECDLQQAGTIGLSKTKRSVTLRSRDGRLYVINADALRDVMHGKIPRATVSEIVSKHSVKNQTQLSA